MLPVEIIEKLPKELYIYRGKKCMLYVIKIVNLIGELFKSKKQSMSLHTEEELYKCKTIEVVKCVIVYL